MPSDILLVDDDVKVLEILSETLNRRGYGVSVATSGEEALLAFEHTTPELVVLDMMLPDMSGLELMKQLRDSTDHFDVPVLFLSANGELEMRLSGLNEGAEDYMVKPVSLKEFNSKVSNVLERRNRANALRRQQDTLESQLTEGREDYTRVNRDLKRQLFSMKTLFSMSQDLNRVLDARQLVKVVSLTLLGELQISSMALFALEKENATEFSMLGVKGFAREKFDGIEVSRDSAFSRMLETDSRPKKLARDPDRTWTKVLPDLRLAVFEHVTPITVKNEIKGLVFTGPKLTGEDYNDYDLDMLMFIANSAGIGMENARLITELEQTYVSTLKSLISIIEAKDPYTKGHTERVATYATAIAERLRMSEFDCRRVTFGALLHDIGKLGVMDTVLHKQGKLTDEEWELLRAHPEVGASIVDKMEFLAGTASMVRHHHESWDGRGYPDGLKGTDIPMGARIIAVADSFDAMTTNRSYRKALSADQAIQRLEAGSGSQYDPDVVEVFVRYVKAKGYERIKSEHITPL